MRYTVGIWAIDILCIALSPYYTGSRIYKKSVAVNTLWIGITWPDWERLRKIPSTHTVYDCILRLIQTYIYIARGTRFAQLRRRIPVGDCHTTWVQFTTGSFWPIPYATVAVCSEGVTGYTRPLRSDTLTVAVCEEGSDRGYRILPVNGNRGEAPYD